MFRRPSACIIRLILASRRLRLIRAAVDEAFAAMSAEFEALCARVGRLSVPPGKLIRALLLQVFFSIRSERSLMQQLDCNLLFHWFVGLSMDAPVGDTTTSSKDRDQLFEADIARKPLVAVPAQPQVVGLMSGEHFSVDGTLIQAWASHKSFRPKDTPRPEGSCDDPLAGRPKGRPEGRNAKHDFRGERRSIETHTSTTDPDERLARKSNNTAAILAYAGHVLMKNRHGMVAQAHLPHATGRAERDAALVLLDRQADGRTLGADRGYDVKGFVEAMVARGLAPHIARDIHTSKAGRLHHSAAPEALARTEGYLASQRIRKRIEEVFGRIKPSAGLRQIQHRGIRRVAAAFSLAITACNLVRLPKPLGEPA